MQKPCSVVLSVLMLGLALCAMRRVTGSSAFTQVVTGRKAGVPYMASATQLLILLQ